MSIWVTAHLPLPYTQQQSTLRGRYFCRYDDATYTLVITSKSFFSTLNFTQFCYSDPTFDSVVYTNRIPWKQN